MTQDNTIQEHQNNAVTTTEDKNQEVVPLAKFLEVKGTLKEMKDKLASFEEKERKLQESKLLEEKNYQELLAKRDAELNSFKSQLEQERANYKVTSVKDKFARILDKNNVIDSNDVLRLVDVNQLVDAEDQDKLINKLVEDLKANKSYLFKQTVQNHNENNRISGNSNKQSNPNAKQDPVLGIWLAN